VLLRTAIQDGGFWGLPELAAISGLIATFLALVFIVSGVRSDTSDAREHSTLIHNM